MKILTVGNSPYNNTSDSSIHAFLLRYLKLQGHDISAACWHHASMYYMPDEDGVSSFDDICALCVLPEDASKVNVLYEHMKQFAPDVVISIGDYHEVDFIFAIKKMLPQFFKWLSVLTIASTPISVKYKEALEYMDYAFLTSEEAFEEFNYLLPVHSECISFRPQVSSRYVSEHSGFNIVACVKNSEQSNIGTLVSMLSSLIDDYDDISAYVHTNVDDDGDYDLSVLKERFSNVGFPTDFVTFYDGIHHYDLMDRLAKGDLFVDCSLTAATGLSAYEATLQGCIPVLSGVGAFSDLLVDLELPSDNVLDGAKFLGQREGFLYIVSQSDLYKRIKGFYDIWKNKPLDVLKLRRYCQDRAEGLEADKLVENIEKKALELMGNRRPVLTVDSF